MLSVVTLKSASVAASYYETKDYYTKGEQQANTKWYGLGAKALGLEGAVDFVVFKKILEGKLPGGIEMHKGYNSNGEPKHRPGYDLTFSAAKSVSILAFKDARIIEAHNRAVIKTLQYIERQVAARVKVNGKVTQKATHNLVVATFLHKVSRALDPDLHTHCVMANMTKLENKWRSLYGDNFYTLKKHLGLHYRLELVQDLMKIGYEIEQTSKEGFFEIKGVPSEVIEKLSKRRQEIKKVLETRGLDSQQKLTMVLNKGTTYEKVVNTVASSMANLVTRERKKTANIEELKQIWDHEVELAGFSAGDLKKLTDEALNRGEIKPPDPREEIIKVMPSAIQDLANRKTIFSMKDLLFSIKSLCITSFPKEPLVEKEIAAYIASKELIHVGDGRFTTKYAIELEKSNINTMLQQQGRCISILPVGVDLVTKFLLKEPKLREALALLLSSNDRFIAVNSQHETDQHKLLQAFNLCALHMKSYIIATKLELAQKFAESAGFDKATSLTGFLEYTNKLIVDQQEGKLLTRGYSTVWIVQRSNLLSSKDVAQLQENAIKLKARVIFLGDHMKRGGVDAGLPFRYLLENNIAQIHLASSRADSITMLREQKTKAAIQEMVQNGSLVECRDYEERLQQAVRFVVKNNGVLITQNNIERQVANNKIRELMQEQGELRGEKVKVPILVPIFLSRIQKETVASFQVGDVIRFNKSIPRSPYKQGDYFNIVDIEPATNNLVLGNKDGQLNSLNINAKTSRVLAVFRRQTRELQQGDLVIWRDGTPRQLQPNKELVRSYGKVLSIDQEKNLTLALPDGTTCLLNLTQLKHQHLDYAYARQLMECSTQTFAKGALLLNNKSHPEITLADLYTGLSAIKENKKIFCDNILQLQQNLSAELGLKEHAHLLKEVDFTPSEKEEYFTKALYATEGTLARHHELLKKIVPEVKLTNEDLNLPKTPEYFQAITAVDFAIAKLSEREAVFNSKDLLDLAKKYDVRVPEGCIETAVQHAINEGLIIAKGEESLVTKEVYAMECACLKMQKQGEGAVLPVVRGPHESLDAVQNHAQFTESQKQAILLAVTSNDRINLVQGVAGAGKTTMLKEVKRLARDAGFELLGVSNTASAKNNLSEKTVGSLYNPDDERTFIAAGIKSKTLASFINQTEKLLETDLELAKQIYSKNTIFVLDEASLVSVRDMFAFLNIVELLDARAIIVGDDRQQPSIEASRAFRLLLGKSNSVVVMNINTRLQTKEALQLMQDVYAVRLDDAFDKLLDNLVEIPDRQERLQAMANYYLGTKKEERAEVMSMLPLNQDRIDFNALVREGLKKENTLTGIEIKTNILVPKDLTHPERTYALSFEAGDLVKFNHNIPRLGINKGDYLVVEGRKNNKVLLRDQNNNKAHWEPSRFAAYIKGAVEVYAVETRQLMAGDEIRWRRNDEARGIINSETALIVGIKENCATVKLLNGNIIVLDLTTREDQHWDHAYGATVHVVQGLDRRNPIGHGIGPYPSVKKNTEVKKDHIIIIPGNEKTNTVSKVGKVIETGNSENGKLFIKAIDRYNKEYKITDKQIEVYPSIDKAKAPKISTFASFLVMATRGDEFIMFVDNMENYKAAIMANFDLKQTALEIMLPGLGSAVKEKVHTMTSVVYGLAMPEEINQPIDKHDKDNSKSLITSSTKEKTFPKATSRSGIIVNFNEKKEQFKKPHFNLDEIKRGLENDILGYVTKWKGDPNKKSAREARWGNKGSFSVVLSGPKAGAWADFETGAAGKDLVSLYMHTFNLAKTDFAKALEDLAHYVGIAPTTNERPSKVSVKVSKEDKQKEQQLAAKKRANYINKAGKLYNESLAIVGTLGEKYLRKFRGIQGELPSNLKFKTRCWHKELQTCRSALIVPGYDKDGKLQSVNRIYLNKDGSKLKEKFKDSDGKLKDATEKMTYGPTLGATIEVNPGHKRTGITYVTEGFENALSIKQVQPNAQIISSFGVGQLKNLTLAPTTKTIVLCADNDSFATNSKGAVLDAIQKWLGQNYEVKIALPFGNKPSDKFDFNDLLKQRGENAISSCLNEDILISKISDLGEKSSPLFQDFLKLKETRELAKAEEAIKMTKEQKNTMQQNINNFER